MGDVPRALCIGDAAVDRVAVPFLRAREVFQIGKSWISHIVLSSLALVASGDAALALAESGVCESLRRI